MNKVSKLCKNAYSGFDKFQTACTEIQIWFLKHYDNENDIEYQESLSVDINQADGIILIDDNGNNFSIKSIIEFIEEYGQLKASDLDKFKI